MDYKKLEKANEFKNFIDKVRNELEIIFQFEAKDVEFINFKVRCKSEVFDYKARIEIISLLIKTLQDYYSNKIETLEKEFEEL